MVTLLGSITFKEVMPLQRIVTKLVPVSQKGQVVIPAKMRKKFKIGRVVMMSEEVRGILIKPALSMEESFGAGGQEMFEVAKELSRDRRQEVESDRS